MYFLLLTYHMHHIKTSLLLVLKWQREEWTDPFPNKMHVSILVVPQLETQLMSHHRQLPTNTQTKVSEDSSLTEWVLKATIHCTWTDESTLPTTDPRAIAKTHSAKCGLVRHWSGKVTNHTLRLLPTFWVVPISITRGHHSSSWHSLGDDNKDDNRWPEWHQRQHPIICHHLAQPGPQP